MSFTDRSRRGTLESKEIDVLLTHPSFTAGDAPKMLLRDLIAKLHSSGHLTDDLEVEIDRYDGIAQMPASIFLESSKPPPPHRRIKFRLVPWDAFVYVQLHATGSEAFIIHVREQAAKIGYKLHQDKMEKCQKAVIEVFGVDGLEYMYEVKNDERQEGDCVLCDSEEDIFRFVQMKYVPPYQRNW